MAYRRYKSMRYRYHDYKEGTYFITTCVKNRKDVFGKIKDSKMIVNEFGNILNERWKWLGEQYSYLILDEHVVMPDHFHGILTINNNDALISSNNVGTGRDLSLHYSQKLKSSQKIKSLSEIMGAFKTSTSREIHLHGLIDFAWQRSYYDVIIKNEFQLNVIRNYIINNPLQLKDYDKII